MRRYILAALFLLLASGNIMAQSDTLSSKAQTHELYGYPLKDVAGYLSANFGEMRPNHFHSGIDFKTDGVENKAVLAIADGYISRILLSHTGYGRAIYITHSNGSVSVYGHLRTYSDKVEEYILQQRMSKKSNRLDLHCSPEQFPVKRGEEIGRSGNTGNSFGPHLHFEIRNAAGRTLNLLASGLYRPKDDIPPYIFKLHYVEVDTLRGVPIHSPLKSYDVEKAEKGIYRLKQSEPVSVGRRGYFIVEVSDRKSNVANRFGVYSLKALIDGKCYFEYRMEGFTFDLSRYCNAVSYYPRQINSKNEVMRLARIDGCPKEFFKTLTKDGVISLSTSEKRQMEIVAEDDCGNISRLEFEICGREADKDFKAKQDTVSPIIDRRYAFRHKEDGLSVLIPRYALYESMLYSQQRQEQMPKSDSSVVILTPIYKLLDRSIPLQKSILVAIKADIPENLRSRARLATRSSKGKISVLGGEYHSGVVEAQVRTLGEYFVVADLTPPRVKPKFEEGADLSGYKSVDIAISDNCSSVSYWAAYVDGKWQPLDYHPVRSVATLSLEGVSAGKHTLRLRVDDSSGNISNSEHHFSN